MKKMKKVMAMALAVSMVAGTASVPSLMVQAAEEKEVVCEEIQVDASQSADLTISTKQQLLDFAEQVSNGEAFRDKKVVLTRNIDMTGSDFPGIGLKSNGSSERFKGTFDGQGHTISGIHQADDKQKGLFGIIGDSGCVQNVTLADCIFESSSERREVGAICGYLEGTLRNCHVRDCYVSGYDSVGGLVGETYQAQLINCSITDSKVTGIDGVLDVGGLVGTFGYCSYISKPTLISNCANIDTDVICNEHVAYRVGGLVGKFEGGKMRNCYSTGMVTGEEETKTGALIGARYNGAFVDNCYALKGSASSLIVNDDNESFSNETKGFCTDQKMQSADFLQTLNATASASNWTKWEFSEKKYPTLQKKINMEWCGYTVKSSGLVYDETEKTIEPLLSYNGK